ncbi:MAG: ATP-binding cassette domain-containing protein, partial [Candidatus Sumerlaeota bacterium]|nr:ATP-binding cassette domain-containing protein [Candidatus Sumerlaeota bacterium]
MPSAPPPAISIRDCRLRLGVAGGEAVEFVLPEFRLAPREQVALTGPSGCGKTTMLNLVSGLLRPDAGAVEIHGTALGALKPSPLDVFRGRTFGFIY